MSSLLALLSASTLFNAYTSVSAFTMLFRTIIQEFIPDKFRDYIKSRIERLNPFSAQCTTILIEEADGLVRNEVYNASETYLRTRINPSVEHLRVIKEEREQNMSVTVQKGRELNDVFEGTSIRWKNFCTTIDKPLEKDDLAYPGTVRAKHRYYKLKFLKKHKEKVVSKYLPYVLSRANAIKEENKVVKIHTLAPEFSYRDIDEGLWESVNMGHPASFATLALDPEMKNEIMEDLDRFVRAKEFYKRVGKAWKRGYLLYGPPGTGKSTLIAAMANYLKFDVYDLELSSLRRDSELRRVLLSTGNRSILVVEDIDCTADLNRKESNSDSDSDSDSEDSDDRNLKEKGKIPKWTLSGLLNFTDGLWSSCGDERIIVFTTNHKDRLDPALLRPGRMDKHIHMSYLTMKAFDILARNYLGIKDGPHQHEKHFKEIEDLIEKAQVTPAEVAEELMKSNDADESLGGLVKFLKRKHMEVNEAKDEREIQST